MKTARNLFKLTLTVSGFAIAAAFFAPALLTAQQPYPDPVSPYAQPQYAQPQDQQPQYNDAQPQYQQPAYQQPQYQQPQYTQPEYQQPQYDPQQPSSQQSYAAPYPDQQSYPGQQPAQPAAPPQSLNPDQLEQMLAPIALYPDALLAQILTASTYPAQVAVADQWLQQMRAQGYGAPDQIAQAAQAQANWDPSVKALTAFPDVLDLLDHDLDWTTALGDAYFNQPQDVMQTVQVLRDRAQRAGNLQSTPQEDVTDNQGYVDIAPPNPEVVYVPTYNPWDVYGAPIAPYPGFSFVGALGSFFGGLPVQYGLSFALGAFEHTPFGPLSWGLDWLGHGVLFNHSGYFTASASVRDWGLPRGGPRAYNGAYAGWRQNGRAPGGYGNPGRSYPTPQNSWQRGNAYGNRAAEQNYARQPDNYRGAPQAYGYARPALPSQNYARPAQQTYAYRQQTYPNRPQTYSNSGYATRPQTYSTPGYSYANRPAQPSYAARPNYAYANPYSSYRTPQTYAPQSYRAPQGYSGGSYNSRGGSYARNDSGGFHLFGGNRQPSYSAPKYSAPRGFGGGGGGHFSAPKAPKMSHSSGGGGRRR